MQTLLNIPSYKEVHHRYDIYGMGNALLDMEFVVDFDFLRQMNLEKGVTTLIGQERQDELLQALRGKKARPKWNCGGSAANTVMALKQMGGTAFFSSRVADDETGDFYYKDLVDADVETNLEKNRPEGVTGKCLILVTPDADRTMNTFLGATEMFSIEDLDKDRLSQSTYLYIEGYLVASPLGRKAAITARQIAEKSGVKTALSFSDPNIVKFFKRELEEVMGMGGPHGIDFLFCNEDEALGFTQTPSVEEAAQALRRVAKNFAITLGPRGALIFNREQRWAIPAPRVEAIDSNGAGDMFAGSFLYGITHGHDFQVAGTLACATSAKLVTEYGARLSMAQAQEVKKGVLL